MCVFVRVCAFQLTLELFSNLANQSEHGTQNLIPQGHRQNTIHIFTLDGLWQAPATPLCTPPQPFLLPPSRQSFRNHLNVLPIDFPTDFIISFKIQRIKKGDTLKIHILPQSHAFTEMHFQDSHMHWVGSRDIF